jgi:hypothetical protein
MYLGWPVLSDGTNHGQPTPTPLSKGLLQEGGDDDPKEHYKDLVCTTSSIGGKEKVRQQEDSRKSTFGRKRSKSVLGHHGRWPYCILIQTPSWRGQDPGPKVAIPSRH